MTKSRTEILYEHEKMAKGMIFTGSVVQIVGILATMFRDISLYPIAIVGMYIFTGGLLKIPSENDFDYAKYADDMDDESW